MTTSIIPQTSGIYKITCTANGKFYIGSSNNFRVRWRTHLARLRRGVHVNIHLQNAFNKYGEIIFRFEIVEIVMPWSILDREQYWLDKLKPFNRAIGFNMSCTANRPSSQKGKLKSKETRAKMSAARKRRPPISEETRAKMSAAKIGKPPLAAIMAHAYKWVVISPDGESMEITNLQAFCRMNGLDATHMCRVAHGKEKQHKGWKCRKAEVLF